MNNERDIHQDRADREGVSRATAKRRNWMEGITHPPPRGLCAPLISEEDVRKLRRAWERTYPSIKQCV